jgi:hypothetical protein
MFFLYDVAEETKIMRRIAGAGSLLKKILRASGLS